MKSSDRLLTYFENNKKVGKFGIKYLDDKLRGILKGDLVLIGARSGAGKSTLAEMIAEHNANLGYKVHLFSLENFEDDAFRNKAYHKYMELTGDWKLHPRDFASGDFNIDADKLIEAGEYAEKIYDKFTITNRKTTGYTLENLLDDMNRVCATEEKPLIILDHLDYVNKDNPNENDNTHMVKLMSKIRELQDSYKVAVVAISHLRKNANQKEMPVIPSVDEFIGSGNKVKESTVVIMVAPADEENEASLNDDIKLTWFSIKKVRNGGIDNKHGLLKYSKKRNMYLDEYDEYVVRGKNKEKVL